jgi:hypothetical protein
VFDNLGGRQRLAPQRLGLGNIPVPGTKAGAIVSLGLVIIAWFAIPVARPFILGTVGLALSSACSCAGSTAAKIVLVGDSGDRDFPLYLVAVTLREHYPTILRVGTE